jgi:hypothetical protein
MNLKVAPEFKCKNCSKGETKHNAQTKACPLGSGQWPSFHASQKFESNGKMTIQSKRAIAKQEELEARFKRQKEDLEREQSIVRSMSFEELVTATVELLSEKTGLGVIVERDRDESALIHLTTLGGRIKLGYTSVTKYNSGRYGVAGTNAGCFMSNHDNTSVSNVLHEDFRALEERANAPKEA